MTIIQIILTIGVALIAIYMYLRLRSSLFDVILIGLFFCRRYFLCSFSRNNYRHCPLGGSEQGSRPVVLFRDFVLIFSDTQALFKIKKGRTEIY